MDVFQSNAWLSFLILHDKYFSMDSRSIHETFCLLASYLQTSSEKIRYILFVFAWFLPSSFAGDGMRVFMFMLVSWVMSSSGCLKAPYIHCLELPDIEHFTMKCNAEL